MRISEHKILKFINTDVSIQQDTIGNYTINYAMAGSGKPLLLIHGVNMGWGQWYPNIEALAKQHQIYALDLPGSGNSTKINFYNMDPKQDLIEVVEQFIQKKNLMDVNIIAHSLGGWIALKLTQSKKIKINKLILENPMGFSSYLPLSNVPVSFQKLAQLLARTAMKPTKKNMTKFFESVMYDPSKLHEALVEYYLEAIKENPSNHPFALINRLTSFFKVSQEFIFSTAELNAIAQDILIIMGDSDTLIPLKKISNSLKCIQNGSVIIYEEVGHVPSIEESQKFNADVLAFLHN